MAVHILNHLRLSRNLRHLARPEPVLTYQWLPTLLVKVVLQLSRVPLLRLKPMGLLQVHPLRLMPERLKHSHCTGESAESSFHHSPSYLHQNQLLNRFPFQLKFLSQEH